MNILENAKNLLAIVIVGALLWVGMSSFFDLVQNVYHFLDGFIWAFFAGIIAFFISVSLVIFMFYITVFVISFILAAIVIVVDFFNLS